MQNELNIQAQLLNKATQLNNDLAEFQTNKKQFAVETDNAAVEAARRADELLSDIAGLKATCAESEKDAVQASFKCKMVVQPKKQNKSLLTLQQTIQQINDIYAGKQKYDLTCLRQGKQLESLRVFLHQYFTLRFGTAQMKKSKQVVSFFYSVGYYRDTNAVCAIFCAEVGLEIDEAFKVNILKLERKIDEIKMDSPKEVLDLMY